MIDLHTTPTANGFKASIMLEEVGLPYRAVNYNLVAGDHMKPGYLAINPVGRVPAIVDHDVAGEPLSIYGTVAVLVRGLVTKTLAGGSVRANFDDIRVESDTFFIGSFE